jgi:polysaccharide pyruvyl transferase WcaK-like protein
LAHSGKGNLGDEILFASALGYYRRRLPLARFVAFTMNPADTTQRYQLADVHPVRPARPPLPAGRPPSRGLLARIGRSLRWRLSTFLRETRFTLHSAVRLRGLDVLVVPGSSQFIDAYGGAWGFPFSLLRWTILARALGVPICYLSMGAEELEQPLSRWMIRRTVAFASYVSVRDPVSRSRLVAQGVRRDLPVTPDLALGYPAPDEARTGGDGNTVGINPIPYFHPAYWRAVDEARYRRYLEAMVALTTSVLQRGQRVVLFSTTPWADGVPIQHIYEALGRTVEPRVLRGVTRPDVKTLEDLWAVLAQVDRVVASRYHGAALALLLRKPVVAVSYEQKTTDLMAAHGLRQYAIPIEDADGTLLAGLLFKLEANEEQIRATLEAGLSDDRAVVHAQFETVLRHSGITPVES